MAGDNLENWAKCLRSPKIPCLSFRSVEGDKKSSDAKAGAREYGGESKETAMFAGRQS